MSIMVKAESLYNTCAFEHALLVFTKGIKLMPEMEELQAGVMKCKKTILSKVGGDNVFFFNGSKYFLDYLRKQGENAIVVGLVGIKCVMGVAR